MKIAMVSMNAGPLAWLGGVDGGGRSVAVDCLSDALRRSGHDVTIFTQRDDGALPDCLTMGAGVHVHHLSADACASDLGGSIAAFTQGLAAQWTCEPPDVIHAHSWMSGKAAAAAARRFDIPIVQTFHGVGRAEPGRRVQAIRGLQRRDEEAVLARTCDRIIATSSSEVFELLGIGASPGAIKLIPCGVDLELFGPSPKPIARGSVFRVITLGRLSADSGVGDVIEALRFIKDVELVVGGGMPGVEGIREDPGVAQFEALARAHGVAARVAFAGRIERDEVAPFLRSADAVVSAPWHDSTGTVALEAMACGVPVIVSAVGALVDVVADGMTGLQVPPRAPRQLAYAIESLRNDAVLRERLGRFGVERTSARYGWARIASETFAVYSSAAGRGARANRSRA